MKKRIFLLLCAVTALLIISGCSNSKTGQQTSETSDKIQVVATIFPIADIMRNIGGDRVNVITLIPAGSSPHTFEATPEQVKLLADSLLFVKVGAGLDNFADKLVGSGNPNMLTITLADKISLINEQVEETAGNDAADEEKHRHGQNPHFWLDPVLVKEILAPEIAQALSAVSPENRDYFEANLKTYGSKLEELNQEIINKTSGLESKSFVAFHSSWSYFCDRYKLNQITVEEFPGKEPSAKWIAGIIDLAKQKKAGAVLIEPQLNPRAAQVLAEEIGIPVVKVDPLGAENIPGYNSYLGLMRSNVDNLAKAIR